MIDKHAGSRPVQAKVIYIFPFIVLREDASLEEKKLKSMSGIGIAVQQPATVWIDFQIFVAARKSKQFGLSKSEKGLVETVSN